MTAADVDVPISRLELRAGGTFAVAWRDSAGGVPARGKGSGGHSRRYTPTAGVGEIKFEIEDGVEMPADFQGHGSFGFRPGR